jgi:hypothetical protein
VAESLAGSEAGVAKRRVPRRRSELLARLSRRLPALADWSFRQELRRLSRFAWPRWPKVVVHLAERFKLPPLSDEITRLVTTDPVRVQDCPEALSLFVGENLSPNARKQIKVRIIIDAFFQVDTTDKAI